MSQWCDFVMANNCRAMKPNRDAQALAARLAGAMNTPVPLPSAPAAATASPGPAANSTDDGQQQPGPLAPPSSLQNEPPAPTGSAGVSTTTAAPPSEEEPPRRLGRGAGAGKRKGVATTAITLRLPKALFQKYVNSAADRSRKAGKVVSAQKMMVEQLERGPA